MAVTPSKQIVACNEGNKAPNTMPSVPKTPSTFTAPMLMAMTPATPCVSLGAKANERTGDKIEYSFEEVRAGFICPSKVQF